MVADVGSGAGRPRAFQKARSPNVSFGDNALSVRPRQQSEHGDVLLMQKFVPPLRYKATQKYAQLQKSAASRLPYGRRATSARCADVAQTHPNRLGHRRGGWVGAGGQGGFFTSFATIQKLLRFGFKGRIDSTLMADHWINRTLWERERRFKRLGHLQKPRFTPWRSNQLHTDRKSCVREARRHCNSG